jgi:hypothetical protein
MCTAQRHSKALHCQIPSVVAAPSQRNAEVRRATKETKIRVAISLDGTGHSEVRSTKMYSHA